MSTFLAEDTSRVKLRDGPYMADPLNYLCLSKYLRLDPSRGEAFLRAATALLDAGADPNTGFWTTGPYPEFETALYGAAGVAHHAPMTRLLLARGANPRDEEACYHSPEGNDSDAMKALVESGKLTDNDLALMLVRKADWHDYEGAKWLLEHGANPNHLRGRGWQPLHHSIRRDNGLDIIGAMLDHHADVGVGVEGLTAAVRAARRGRGDVLANLDQRGITYELKGVDRLTAACARHDRHAVDAMKREEPALVVELLAMGGQRLTEFAGTWNTEGVAMLLGLGVPVNAACEGDGYFDIAKGSTALHVAAWKGVASTVKLLLARGAAVDALDGKSRTPLMLAVKATVDSYWTYRRTPEAVQALLDAGSTVAGVRYPSGYAEVDVLLASHGAGHAH